MLNGLPWRRRHDEAAAKRTDDLLAGAPPRDRDDHDTLRVVRALRPAIYVPQDQRRDEMGRMLRAADASQRPPSGPIPIQVDSSPAEPTLHTADMQLGEYTVVLVDIEAIDDERARVASSVMSNAIVERISLRQRDGYGE